MIHWDWQPWGAYRYRQNVDIQSARILGSRKRYAVFVLTCPASIVERCAALWSQTHVSGTREGTPISKTNVAIDSWTVYRSTASRKNLSHRRTQSRSREWKVRKECARNRSLYCWWQGWSCQAASHS